MIFSELKDGGLFVFSDPAGAKACLGLFSILKNDYSHTKNRVISNKQYAFYAQFNIEIEIVEKFDTTLKTLKNLEWVFSGTSHPESSQMFELYFLKYARENFIFSYSFIDHWTNFFLRFTFNQDQVYPDIIFVLDNYAKDLALRANVPASKIEILENPYHTYLKNISSSHLTKADFCHKLGIDIAAKTILYAPDPISLRSNSKINEFSVFEELIGVIDTSTIVVVKLHPLQPTFTYASNTVFFLNENDFSIRDLCKNVDFIIGFYSNFLIEASLFNSNIIRYILQSEAVDYLNHLNIGRTVHNKLELKESING